MVGRADGGAGARRASAADVVLHETTRRGRHGGVGSILLEMDFSLIREKYPTVTALESGRHLDANGAEPALISAGYSVVRQWLARPKWRSLLGSGAPATEKEFGVGGHFGENGRKCKKCPFHAGFLHVRQSSKSLSWR
jgi:hypothetical protein